MKRRKTTEKRAERESERGDRGERERERERSGGGEGGRTGFALWLKRWDNAEITPHPQAAAVDVRRGE